MSFGLRGLGLDKELSMIMNANRPNPSGLQGKIVQQQRAGITPQLLDVLASQKLLKEKQDAKTAMMADAAPSAGTIAQQQDAMLKQQAVADLQREADVAKQVGIGNAIANLRNKRLQQAALKQLTGAGKPKGIAGAPVSKPMTAAQGGIVGFQSGNQVNLPAQVPPKPPMRFNVGVIERQRERRQWDEQYGDNYNTDGTLKGATTPTPGLLERATGTGLGEILGQNLTQQGSGMSGLGSGAQYLPDDRRVIAKGSDFATQKFFQSPPIGSPTYKEETGTTPPMPVLMPPMQGPPMPPPSIQETPELPKAPSTEMAPKGIKSLQFQPKDNLAAVLRAFQGGNPAAVQSLLAERDRQTQLEVDKFNIESDLKLQRLENDKLATQIKQQLNESIARGDNRNALFNQLNKTQQLIQNATEGFDSVAGMSLKAKLDQYAEDYSKSPSERKLKRYQAAQEAYDQALSRALGDLPETADAIREAIARLDFDTSRPATQI